MPRQRSLVTVIRDLVQQEVRSAIRSLLSTVSPKKQVKNGRRRPRRRTRGTWRPGGPGRPPKVMAEKAAKKKTATVKPKAKVVRRRRKRRGPGRSAGSKTKAA